MKWIACAAFGLEGLTLRDLKRLDVQNAKTLNVGGASFEGDFDAAFSANLWLRTADRILLELARFRALSFEDLFQAVKAVPWEEYFAKDAAFDVKARCVKSTLMSETDCQKIVKKAVAERMMAAYHVSWCEEKGTRFQIDLSIRDDEAVLALDASGQPLSKRGYRTWNGEAPLRETLAAALVLTSGWHPWQTLIDPCCGTGTILVEAAMIALNRAPGLLRPFAMESWPFANAARMKQLRAEAQEKYDACKDRPLALFGSDIDPNALELARRHVRQAGFDGRIHLEEKDLRNLYPTGEPGCLIANPPYGERLGDRRVAHAIAKQLGQLYDRAPGWTMGCLSADMGFEREFGHRAARRRYFYNGRIECEYHIFAPASAPRKEESI